MKRFIKSKKGLALLATLVVAAAGAVAGYAYFTSTGNGSGSASVGAAGTWAVSADTLKGTLYPDPTIGTGGNHATVNYSVTNSGTGDQELNSVAISIPSTWTVTGTQGGCNASDFSLDGAAVGSAVTDTYGGAGNDLHSGASTGGHVDVEMIDNGSNQNDCQNVTVPISFSAG